MKFFLEEQHNYSNVSCKISIRCHQMIIQYFLALKAKSAAVDNEIRYDEKTGTGFVVLPTQRKLRDYKNYVHPKRCFNHEIINKLRNKIKDFSNIDRFMVTLFDILKIQENLVWSKHIDDLIDFVDLSDANLNYVTFPQTNADNEQNNLTNILKNTDKGIKSVEKELFLSNIGLFYTARGKVLNNFKNRLFQIKNPEIKPEQEPESEPKLEKEPQPKPDPKYRKSSLKLREELLNINVNEERYINEEP